ncbi:hypothetical protein OTU49_016872 [Cherax quadricarinatus]|uniref:Tetratricopeptide repeat protein 19 n=2 Tax=Cherax quadricarinatus TaxID=27406 RepID=A0AAW0Y5F7_CHEQU|nr:tetratricopeptide repeat protein 19 homolog, mitochondrial-like [Cherax quadricarinatus]
MIVVSNCRNFVKIMRLSLLPPVQHSRYSLLRFLYKPQTSINMGEFINYFRYSKDYKIGCSNFVDGVALGLVSKHSCGHRGVQLYEKTESEDKSRNQRKWMHSALIALTLFSTQSEGKEEKKDSELITMIKRGILALKRGELQKAEQLLHVALKSAQETQNELAIIYIYDLLANLAYQREEYLKAEKLFKEVLQRILSGGMAEDDNAVVEISLKLASVYASMFDYEKAVEGFQFCIATQEDKIKKYGEKNLDEDTLLLWAMSMDWYARFLLNIKKYDLAKKHFVKAYEMSERINGLGHEQTAVLLNDIGSVCSLQKDYTEAIEYLEKAIDAARECKSLDIGSFYVNLGTVYLQQSMIAEAERCCKEGLILSKKMENKDATEEAKICLEEIQNLLKKK